MSSIILANCLLDLIFLPYFFGILMCFVSCFVANYDDDDDDNFDGGNIPR